MTFRGHVHNGLVVFDEPAPLPEGIEVQVSLVHSPTSVVPSQGDSLLPGA